MRRRIVPTAPNNVWTRPEFDAWIAEMVQQEVGARADLKVPPMEGDEYDSLMAMIVHSLNTGIVPAGNA